MTSAPGHQACCRPPRQWTGAAGLLGCLHALILQECYSQAALKEGAAEGKILCPSTSDGVLHPHLGAGLARAEFGVPPRLLAAEVLRSGPSRFGSCFSVSAPQTPPEVLGTFFSSQRARGLWCVGRAELPGEPEGTLLDFVFTVPSPQHVCLSIFLDPGKALSLSVSGLPSVSQVLAHLCEELFWTLSYSLQGSSLCAAAIILSTNTSQFLIVPCS